MHKVTWNDHNHVSHHGLGAAPPARLSAELPVPTYTFANHRATEPLRRLLGNCERRRYSAKAVIIAQDDVSRHLFFLIKGSATVRMRMPSGNYLVLRTIHAGEFFGEAGLFENDPLNTAAVRAKVACEIACISHARVLADPELLADLLPRLAPQLAMRLERSYLKAAEMAFDDTETRVSKTLRDLARAPDAVPHADGSAISVTRTELGSMTGASREAVGRVLMRMQQQGLVRTKGYTMVVLKSEACVHRGAPLRPKGVSEGMVATTLG